MINWHTETRKLSNLKANKKNPRKLSENDAFHLRTSLEKFGLDDKIIINLDDTIIGGHQRKKVLQNMGIKEVEVLVPDRELTEKECDEFNIRLNRNAGEWDWDILANEWNIDELVAWGFNPEEFSLPPVEEIISEDDDFEEELPEKAQTILGDVYELGSHKLICGSATSVDDIKKLLGEEQVDLVLTDPPYNVAYVGKTKDALTIENDQLSDVGFEELLRDFYVNAFSILKEGSGIYVFHADLEGEKFRRYFRESGLKLTQCLIWEKNSMVMGRQDYHWQHEPCLYGWKPGASHNWYSDRKQTTLLKFDRPQRNAEHPTMKPLPLIGYLIQNSSKQGDLIFDFFLGSGTTLIAAEQLNRRCYGCELDPKYCDVIVNRWKNWMNKNGRAIVIKKNGVVQNG